MRRKVATVGLATILGSTVILGLCHGSRLYIAFGYEEMSRSTSVSAELPGFHCVGDALVTIPQPIPESVRELRFYRKTIRLVPGPDLLAAGVDGNGRLRILGPFTLKWDLGCKTRRR